MDLRDLECLAALCEVCSLYRGRKNPVFARGNPNAKLMLCGMVPGPEENEAGSPFVGRSGKLLNEALSEYGITENEIYVTNLVKCFLQPGKPLKQEWIDSCKMYLKLQIEIIKPSVIVTMGKDATYTLLNYDNVDFVMPTLSTIRGNLFQFGNCVVIPTFHPSYVLRQGGKISNEYALFKDDLAKAFVGSVV